MPAVPSSVAASVRGRFAALLPAHARPARLRQAGPGAGLRLRRRRDERGAAGVVEALRAPALASHGRTVGLAAGNAAVNRGVTSAPRGGRGPVDRGTPGLRRSVSVGAAGIPPATIAAPASRHDSPLLRPTLDALSIADRPMLVRPDRGHDPGAARERLAARGLAAAGRGADPRPQEAGLVHGAPRRRGRLPDRFPGGARHRRPPRWPSPDPLPLGDPAASQAAPRPTGAGSEY